MSKKLARQISLLYTKMLAMHLMVSQTKKTPTLPIKSYFSRDSQNWEKGQSLTAHLTRTTLNGLSLAVWEGTSSGPSILPVKQPMSISHNVRSLTCQLTLTQSLLKVQKKLKTKWKMTPYENVYKNSCTIAMNKLRFYFINDLVRPNAYYKHNLWALLY